MRFAGLGPIAEYDCAVAGHGCGLPPDGSPQKKRKFVMAITQNFGAIGIMRKE
jgi:hypothetical protein